MNPPVFAGVLVGTRASRQQPATPVSAGAVAAVLVWMFAGPVGVVARAELLGALERGAWLDAATALAWAVGLAILLFPWPIARRLLIPLGLPKLAWAVTRLSLWTWRGDVRGGAVVAASWAAIRQQQRREAAGQAPDDAETLAWIERRRDASRFAGPHWTIGGAAIAATGFLAEARGDRAGARRLLSSVLELAEPTRPRRAATLALEWLCGEAIERGAWREVEFLARTAACTSRHSRWLGSVAARLTAIAPLPSDVRLVWLWALAPDRRAQLPLLRRALASASSFERRDAAQPVVTPPIVVADDPLVQALTLHAHTLVREPEQLSRDDLARLGAAWDLALDDPQLEQRLHARGQTLGTTEVQRTAAELAELVRDDLLALVRAAGLELGSLSDTSDILGRAARQLHAELLDGIETSTGSLDARVKAKRELPPIDEWQAFLGVREQYASAVALGGLELRRLAFQAVHAPICALAVWLWNVRSERALANAMFHWLLAEAIIVDDAEAIRLQEKNVGCGV